MNKFIKLTLTLSLVFVLTGCLGNKNKLICTKEENSQTATERNITNKEEIIFKFKDSKLLSYTVGATTILPEEEMNTVDTILDLSKVKYKEYEGHKGVKSSVKKLKNGIFREVTFEIKNMSDESQRELETITEDTSREVIKNSFEVNGYKCK